MASVTTIRACRHRVARAAVAIALFVCAAGCTDTASPPSGALPDGWLGRWNGPEGTFLLIEGGAGRYTITITNLDGPLAYEGTAAGAEIVFERNGEPAAIRATNGAATGMKWLTDKSDCLTIRYGEGFCRD